MTTAPASPTSPDLSTIVCDSGDVFEAISSFLSVTVSGPDSISSRMLKGTAAVISYSLANCFQSLLGQGGCPSGWKLSNITPVYKVGNRKLVSNYRPISLLSLPSKLLGRIVHNTLMTLSFLLTNSILPRSLFGFRPASSTQEAIISATGDWYQHLDSKKNVAVVLFDLSKAFDTVPHHGLLNSLFKIGISGSLLKWFRSYLSGKSPQVVHTGWLLLFSCSRYIRCTSGVHIGSPVIFHLHEPDHITITLIHLQTAPVRGRYPIV